MWIVTYHRALPWDSGTSVPCVIRTIRSAVRQVGSGLYGDRRASSAAAAGGEADETRREGSKVATGATEERKRKGKGVKERGEREKERNGKKRANLFI